LHHRAASVLDLIGTPDGARGIVRLVSPSLAWATGVVTLHRDTPSPMVAALRTVAAGLAASFGNDE